MPGPRRRRKRIPKVPTVRENASAHRLAPLPMASTGGNFRPNIKLDPSRVLDTRNPAYRPLHPSRPSTVKAKADAQSAINEKLGLAAQKPKRKTKRDKRLL